jgi:2-C-methyl-D-erythritol 4-phosphate cytidylyltransferase
MSENIVFENTVSENTVSEKLVSASPRYWAIVPAAGSGSRMGSSVPKQYMTLGTKTIIEHTLERLLAIRSLAGVVVAVSKQDANWQRLAVSRHPLIHCVEGGAERANSVLNALLYLQDKIQPHDWVLVHDAARPCVTLASIESLCAALCNDPVGGILAVPVSDTLKQVDLQQSILNTLDRRLFWQAQTPQLFRYKLLLDCLTNSITGNKPITDEASALEFCGFSPKVVEGRNDNIKITRADDLGLAAFILQQQNEGK